VARPPLSEDAIRDILTSQASHRVLALRHGCHHSAVAQIRDGKSHASVAPELPRRQPLRRCSDCQHWQHGSECGLGFPDPQLEGIQFARDCSTYAART
jgi:hypothetical protein